MSCVFNCNIWLLTSSIHVLLDDDDEDEDDDDDDDDEYKMFVEQHAWERGNFVVVVLASWRLGRRCWAEKKRARDPKSPQLNYEYVR